MNPCLKVNHEIGDMHEDITKVGPRLPKASLNHSSHSKCTGFADLQVHFLLQTSTLLHGAMKFQE